MRSAIVAVIKDLWRFIVAGFAYAPLPTSASLEFDQGVYYGPNDPITNRVRLLLSGQYQPHELERSLQPNEYIVYYLVQAGIKLPSQAKTWEAGRWHQHLKGESAVHISITPKKNSIMEFFTAEKEGKMAIVKNVTEDMTIICAGFDLLAKGTFDVCIWSVKDWQEYRPVFINFTKSV